VSAAAIALTVEVSCITPTVAGSVTMSLRHHLRPLHAPTVLLVACGSGTAVAAPPTSAPTLGVDGHVQLFPGLEFFHVQTTATKAADGSTSGSFLGTGEVRSGPVDLPIPLSLTGPVTCLDVQGSSVSFLYTVDSAQPKFLNDVIAHTTSVLFTIVKGANGTPDRVGFFGPLPTAYFHGCGPIGTPLVFNGTVDIGGGS